MSRSKSYRSLSSSLTEEKSSHLEHATSSIESMALEAPASTQRGSLDQVNSGEVQVSAINIYHKLFLPDPNSSGSFSSKGCGKENRVSPNNSGSRTNSFPFSKSSFDKEGTYGWFVQTDDEHDHEVCKAYSTSSAAFDDLAFKAPTAPKRVNDNAEVEWARAADTVDDVLRDLF